MLSVVITTYQRVDVVSAAIDSALTFINDGGGEVVVVDDASRDGTAAFVKAKYEQALAEDRLQVVELPHNVGVSGAKNAGFGAARNAWVTFLDSDDTLLAAAAAEVVRTLKAHPATPLVFFRCVDQDGEFVGQQFDDDQLLETKRYLRWTSYGEALVAINKGMVRKAPFDVDLRGYEGLGCARVIRHHGAALLSTVTARRYDRSRSDRLSSLAGFLGRCHLIARGHLRFIKEFWRDTQPSHVLMLVMKSVVYMCAGNAFRWWRGERG